MELTGFYEIRTAILICFVTYMVTVVLKAFHKWFKMFAFFQALPGVQDFSLIWGNLHLFRNKSGEERIAFNLRQVKKHPKMSRFWVGPLMPIISVCHQDSMKLIYQSSAPKGRGFGQSYRLLESWIGNGLISSNHGEWARNRRLLTPAFHFDILKNYMEIYHQAADVLIKKLDKFAETGESFDLYPLAKLCTLDVIMKCAMGYDINVQEHPDHPYVVATSELNGLFLKRALTPYHGFDFIYRLSSNGRKWYKHCDLVHSVAEGIIEKRRQSLQKEGLPKHRHLDFLDTLLTAVDSDGKTLTPLEIRHEVDTFMFAGHDTTSAALPWILYALADSQEHLKKVQDELDFVTDDARDNPNVQWQDLSRLKHLSLCIKESMRMYPPVPIITRILDQDMEIDGYSIPSGTNITLNIIGCHRNPAVWDEPDKFMPERFEAKNRSKFDSFAFTPFSAGARNCIGQNFALNEEKTLLSRILQRYHVEVAPDHPPPMRANLVVLKSENGIWFRVKRR